MPLKFQKMHGAGNDFVLLDLRDQAFEMDSDKAAGLADRRTGIGCDQVLILSPPSDPACLVDFDVWNADGSRAEQCGNGVRCIGLYLKSRGETPPGIFTIQGPVSRVSIEAMEDGQFRVNMGYPAFEPEKVPVNLEPSELGYPFEYKLQTMHLGAVSMGNPHALMVVPDAKAAKVEELGLFISRHPLFPQGCNAGFAEIIDRKIINLRVFERGAGETLACGSGACAAVVILIQQDKLDQKVLVKQVGGTLIIVWKGANESVMMTGPAFHMFEGMLT